MYPGEGEREEECEYSWVVDYTGKKLEDIVDLNSAEKTMMNLWNAHVIKYQVTAGLGGENCDISCIRAGASFTWTPWSPPSLLRAVTLL